MSSLGQTLRQAREAKGLSQSKVAAETRILVQIVDDIENEDFHRIAAPIYGRGFVRLFAECVGLDPQPLIREFMDIYEGRRAPTVHVRDVPVAAEPAPPPVPPTPPPEPPSPVPPVPISEPPPRVMPVPPAAPSPEPMPAPLPVEPPPETAPAPAVEPPPAVRGLDLFDQPASAPVPPVPAPARTTPPVYEESPFLPPTYEDDRPSASDRFRSSLSSVSHGVVQSMRGIPRSTWRKALLAVGALVVLALLVFGCVKLYQMTTPAASDPSCAGGVCTFEPTAPTPQAAAPKQATPAKTDASPSKPAAKTAPVKLRSTGQKIPPLYID